ncbi:serine/threonine protein kinase [Gammaproteobacteria bacterium]|nr:serine/threonine protein kinase [Gammaproteobacteria bacterium]
MNPDRHQNALNQGDKLNWYEIETILGHGGFGITYLALDTNLNHKVAIKEFLPVQFATRGQSSEVQPISDQDVEKFEWGKKRFLDEARTLFPFRHPNIVRVHSFFESNQTGYIVMEYVEGVDLADLIEAGEPFTESELIGIINPVLEGLSLVHDEGFIHRDIKPRNIVIRNDGSPVLIDFGSARQALGEHTGTMTALVSPGYSPLEQYHGASGHQGPWTDIYALGATLYAATTGKAPIDSLLRNAALTDKKDDPYLPLVDIVADKYSRHFLAAIDHALQFAARDRPHDLAEWGNSLCADMPTQVAGEHNDTLAIHASRETGLNETNPVSPLPSQLGKSPVTKNHKRIGLLLVIIALGVFAFPGWISDITSINVEPILNNKQADADANPAFLASEKIPPDEMDKPEASVDINGFYGSEITFSEYYPNINGHWYFGEAQELQVKIEQRGDDVLGFIAGIRKGRIEGSYSGNEVNFRFNIVDPDGNTNQGSGVWFVASDGNKMIGKWILVDQNDGSTFLEGGWRLTRFE